MCHCIGFFRLEQNGAKWTGKTSTLINLVQSYFALFHITHLQNENQHKSNI